MTKRVYRTKTECQAMGLLDRPTLRAMRLKPAKGQKPDGLYWQGHGTVAVFAVAACMPMAPYRAPTAAQLDALASGRQWLGTIKCADCAQRFELDYFPMHSSRCYECIDTKRLADRDLSVLPEMSTVYLDTETTGLWARDGDEIVEISICNDVGQVLIDSLVKPTVQTAWPEAQEIHGIAPDDVQSAPVLGDLMPGVLDAIRGRRVVIYNAAFDTSFFPIGTFDLSEVRCCMLRFAEFHGEWNDYRHGWRWHKLTAAAWHVGHQFTGEAHRALPDALATRSVWRWLQAGAPPRPPSAPGEDEDLPF